MLDATIIPVPGFCEPLASWLHLAAAVIAAGAGIRHLPTLDPRGRRRVAFGVFWFGAVFVFTMSGVFHLLDHGGTAREVLRRLDYAAIWTLVAGTITPLVWVRHTGGRRWLALGGVWSVAITGIVINTVFLQVIPEGIVLGMYFLLSGVGLASVRGLWRDHDAMPMVWGCLAYSIGAGVEFARSPVVVPGVLGHHEIFHIAVIIGVTLHWRSVMRLLATPTTLCLADASN